MKKPPQVLPAAFYLAARQPAICGFLLSEWVAPGNLEDPDYGPHEYTSACIFPPGHEGRHSWA